MIHYRAVRAVNINIMVIWNVTPYNSIGVGGISQ